MIQTLKRITPAPVRRALRPLTLAYQQRTQARNAGRLFGNFIAPGDLVFDIGANTGRMTDLFLSLGAKVYAVEPQPACAARILDRHGHNKRCHVLQMGVGFECGEREMHVCGDIDEVSSFRPDWDRHHYAAKFTGTIQVTMTTMDRLIRLFGMPDFCKIDVEGYEWPVLRGLSRPIGNLSFEYHRHQWGELEGCLIELRRLGAYRYNFAPHEEQCLQHKDWLTGPQLMEWLGCRKIVSGDVFARIP